MIRSVVVLAAAAVMMAVCCVSASGVDRVDVFSAGENGYFCIKIPALLVTSSKTILAFGEGRRESCSDFAWTDIVMKRSVDNGATWSNITVVVTNSSATEKNVIGNVAPVQDRANQRIIMPYCRNNIEVYQIYSDDDGLTWSKPTFIPNVVLPEWRWVGTGPPAALQLESGRLLVPSYHETRVHEDGTFTKGHTMLSDDGGATWRLGQTFGGMHFPNECQAVDLGNNTVLINARGIGTRRIQTTSHDGGETFGPMQIMKDLPASIDGCEGSMIKLASGNLLFSNPHEGRLYRYNMTVLVSEDKGDSWQECRLVDSGASGYSALAQLSDQTVGLLYERADDWKVIFTPNHITFERVWYPGCNAACGCAL